MIKNEKMERMTRILRESFKRLAEAPDPELRETRLFLEALRLARPPGFLDYLIGRSKNRDYFSR